jgi:hypothetical protein
VAVAHPVTAAPRVQARAARANPGTIAIGVICGLSIAVVLVLLYALWEFWPTQAVLAAGAAQPVHLFGVSRDVSTEIRLFVIVALAGSLGGVMHSTRSAAWYVGHGGLRWRWVPYYLVTIALGAGLASVFYLVIRGGVFTGKATSADVNPYGFAAIAALVGLFTEQALVMLKRIASQVFAEAPQGSDNAADVLAASGSAAGTASPAAQSDVSALLARTATATGVTASSAILEGDASANGSVPACHFDYGTTTAYGQTTAVQVATSSGQSHVTATVDGLAPATEYHFRLVVASPDGQWTTGDDATFTTNTG